MFITNKLTKRSAKLAGFLLLLLSLVLGLSAVANRPTQVQAALPSFSSQSSLYTITAHVLNEGGGESSSSQYRVFSTIGNEWADVELNSSQYRLHSGPIPVLFPPVATSCPTTVTNLNDGGAGSLRSAIDCANMNAGADTIDFNVVGTITLLTSLPALNDASGGTTIDGTTAPAFAGVPLIALAGPGTNSFDALTLSADNNTIRGLQIGGFFRGVRMTSSGNLIAGNYIGHDGTTAVPNSIGLDLFVTSGNLVGGTTVADRNVISGNSTGISLNTTGAGGNTVQGNYIGTDPTGLVALGNFRGIQAEGGGNNLIGGTTTGAGNLISGNNNDGLLILSSSNNVVEGNLIGTNATGLGALGNGAAGSGDGIELTFASNNQIGGTTAASRNIISGNNGRGIIVQDATAIGNIIQGNFIGTDINGTAVLANSGGGISNSNAINTLIGGSTAGAGNLISGNGNGGIAINGDNVTVQGNLIGTDVSGSIALPNPFGIFVGGTNHQIGGTTAAARNLVSGNTASGIQISGSSSSGTVIQGNFIGTDITGMNTLGNGENGVSISNAPGNTVGGAVSGAGNLIAGNGESGVLISSSGAIGNVVQGNWIGLNAAGTAVIPNGTASGSIRAGIDIGSGTNNTTIGGTAANAGNVIAGNIGFGIDVSGGNVVIEGNFIGTDPTGTMLFANTNSGIFMNGQGDNTIIGGTAVGAGNLIAGGSANHGIEARNDGSIIQGNLIGTDITGTADFGSRFYGIALSGANNTTIGGPTAAARNLISGNGDTSGAGIEISNNSSNNVVEGNYIGTTLDGLSPLGNAGDGIHIRQATNTTVRNNRIAHNGVTGIAVLHSSSSQNEITQNEIYDNGELGIDLSNGFTPDSVTANDAGDADAGANGLQNYPVFTTATSNGSTTTVMGSFNSLSNASYTLEFYSNAVCDSSGSGEGRTFIHTESITTNGSGDAPLNVTIATAVSIGDYITAIATDANGNSSEFSACVQVTVANQPPTIDDSTFAVAEDAANGTSLGAVTASDPDVGDVLTFAIIGGNTDAIFAIDNNGEITVADNTNLDFETTSSYVLTVEVTDSGGLTDTATITINVTGVNEPPTVDDGTFAVAENAINGTSVGTAVYSDPDALDTTTFSIISGNTDNIFALDNSGEITVADNTNLDFETTSSYTLVIQLADSGGLTDTAALTINVTDENDAPTVLPTTLSVAEDAANGTALGMVTASDPDAGHMLTLAITAGNGDAIFAIDNSGQITVDDNTNLDFETTSSYVLTVEVTDNGGLTDSALVTVNVTNANEPPTVDDGTFAVAENAINGTSVGTAVYSDPDALDTTTFSIISGNTDNIFAIDNNGEITVADNSNLDFETTSSYVLVIQVSDSGGLTDTATITINVTDENDAPTVLPTTLSVAEDAANGTALGMVTASDPDAGYTLTFAITAGNSDAIFAIDNSGQITVADNTNLDFETTSSFALTVEVTDNGGLTDSATITIDVTNVNEPPTVEDSTFGIAEDAPNGAVLGTAVYADPDAGDTTTFAILAGNADAIFAIDNSGQITIVDSSNLDFETTSSYALTVEVSDNSGLTDTATITVNVTDVNEPPTVDDSSFAVAEDAANGTLVGTVTATDPDAGDTPAYAIIGGNGDAIFGIDSNGQITVDNNSNLDFETTNSYSLTVEATDDGGLTDTATITVNVTDENDAPTVSGATLSIAEDAANGTALGVVSASDPDAGHTLTFAITAGNGDDIFAIDNGGQITVDDNTNLNFEATSSYALTVEVTDNGGLTDSAIVTVNVTDENDPPTVDDATLAVAENAANGTVVGTAVFSDPDAGATATFAILAGNTDAIFAIDNSGQITVDDNSNLDFETTNSYNLTIELTDNGGLTDTATVVINVTDENDPPIVNDNTFAVPENAANGTVVGTAVYADPDVSDTATFAILSGNTDAIFAIDNGGQITVDDNSNLDFETTSSYALTVQVADGSGLTDTATITINITNIPEADLTLTKADDIDPIGVENMLTYTLTVANNGPEPATSILLTDTLPIDVTFETAVPTQGSCSEANDIVSCHLGTLLVGETAVVSIVVTPSAAGTLTNTAVVVSNEVDPNPADNSASETTVVNAAFACAGVAATIIGTPGDDILDGTPGDDVIVGRGGNDVINGLGGNDIICGGNGNDIISGNNGNDELRGGQGDDTLRGNSGDDNLRGGRGDDQLYGGSGMDIIRGNRGFDLLRGGIDNDELRGGQDDDTLEGGDGDDTLWGGLGNDLLRGQQANDTLNGGPDADDLRGGNGDDLVNGNAGDDTLRGGNGTDTLNGGNGIDTCLTGETVTNCEL